MGGTMNLTDAKARISGLEKKIAELLDELRVAQVESDDKRQVILDYEEAVSGLLTNQKRLLESLIGTSQMVRASEAALDVYRKQILASTEKAVDKGARSVLQFWTFNTKDGWERK